MFYSDDCFFFLFIFLCQTVEEEMGKKDASATKLPVDQYRKQIGEFSVLLMDRFVL